MERGKSYRESQTQAFKEIIAEFDLETQINKIAIRCFKDLLENNKQAFQYLVDNEKRMSDIEMRLTKTEGFTTSIESYVNSKVEVTDSLSKRLEVFSKQFFDSLKENQGVIRTIRKDYDSVLSSTLKNAHELRSVTDELKKSNSKITEMDALINQSLSNYTNKLGENTLDLQKQIIQIRTNIDKLSEGLTHSKADFMAKGTQFQEVSSDMMLYKHEREIIERRLDDMLAQLSVKTNKTDVHEMRLYFDSQIVTQSQSNSRRFNQLSQNLKNQIKERKSEDQLMNERSTNQWNIQNQVNEQLKLQIETVKNDLSQKSSQLQSQIKTLQSALEEQMLKLRTKQIKDDEHLKSSLHSISAKLQKTISFLQEVSKEEKMHYQELRELNQNLHSLNQMVGKIQQQNEKRKQELLKLQTEAAQSSIGDEMSSINGAMNRIRQEIIENKRMTTALSKSIEQLTKSQSLAVSELQQNNNKIKQTMANQKQDIQTKFIQTNRRINDVSIQLMKSIQKAQEESKKYTDQLKEELKIKLEIINQLRIEIQALKQQFKEQMREAEKVNKLLAEKMERSTSIMTKFKSDITLRVDGIANQQQRRSIEIKDNTQLLSDMRRHVSNMTECLNIALAIGLSRQTAEEVNSEPIKISSLIEGWVIEIDDKYAKYRGELLQRKKLLWVCMNFMSYQGDKVKGNLIQSGKEVYFRMMEQQQIFTARKKGMSKKGGSELPKLHL